MTDGMTDFGGYRQRLRRIGGALIPTAVGAAAVLLLWRPCLPFVCAYLFAGVLVRPHRWFLQMIARQRSSARRTAVRHSEAAKKGSGGIVGWLAAALLVVGCVLVGGGLLWLVCRLLWSEICRLFAWLADNAAEVTAEIGAVGGRLASFIGALFVGDPLGEDTADSLADTVTEVICGMLGTLLSTVTAGASAAVAAFAAALPKILLFFAVFLLASVYMTAEYDTLSSFFRRLIPTSLRRRWDSIRHGIGSSVGGLLLAYGKMAALTFALLYIGLRLIGIRGAFTAAFLGAVIDILPLIGVGAVLLPWALFSFFCGRSGLGVGLVVLYLVIAVTRQTVEPRLVGRGVGLHPLAALFAMYAGGVLIGAVGMIAAPLLLSVIVCGYRAVKHDGQ